MNVGCFYTSFSLSENVTCRNLVFKKETLGNGDVHCKRNPCFVKGSRQRLLSCCSNNPGEAQETQARPFATLQGVSNTRYLQSAVQIHLWLYGTCIYI